jgi:hypothetical protein
MGTPAPDNPPYTTGQSTQGTPYDPVNQNAAGGQYYDPNQQYANQQQYGYQQYNPSQQYYANQQYGNPQYGSQYPVPYNTVANMDGIATSRNIAVCVILSIVTFGIYEMYWMYKLNEEIDRLSGETNATSGGLVILFTIITFNIYGIYWAYKKGQLCDRVMGRYDGDGGLICLLLALFLSIGSLCYIQNTINKVVRA